MAGADRIAPLPEALFADAIALWHAAGLTRPWNDPDEDLHRAMRGPGPPLVVKDAGATGH